MQHVMFKQINNSSECMNFFQALWGYNFCRSSASIWQDSFWRSPKVENYPMTLH